MRRRNERREQQVPHTAAIRPVRNDNSELLEKWEGLRRRLRGGLRQKESSACWRCVVA